jgi:hypothetical protein
MDDVKNKSFWNTPLQRHWVYVIFEEAPLITTLQETIHIPKETPNSSWPHFF